MAKLLQIDPLTRKYHSYLTEEDECYYVLEYTPRQGPTFSSTNDLVFNLKKSVDRKGRPEYFYKLSAIEKAGDLLRSVLDDTWIKSKATFVPIPCSKTRSHALYDDRMLQVIRRMTTGLKADVRDMLIQNEDLEYFHEGYRMAPQQLSSFYTLDHQLVRKEPKALILLDDMLTTGCHFKAAQSVIRRQWPTVLMAGIFIARAVRDEEGFYPHPA